MQGKMTKKSEGNTGQMSMHGGGRRSRRCNLGMFLLVFTLLQPLSDSKKASKPLPFRWSQDRDLAQIGGTKTVMSGERRMTLETLSLVPPIYVLQNLASKAETKHIRRLAEQKGFRQSITGEADKNELRKSEEQRLKVNEDPKVLGRLNVRLRAALGLGSDLIEEGDGWSIIRYRDQGGFYKSHMDWDIPEWYRGHPDRHRLLTVQLYLSDPPSSGGETWFPLAHTNNSLGNPAKPLRWPTRQQQPPAAFEPHDRQWLQLGCMEKLTSLESDHPNFAKRLASLGLKVRPQQPGDALLFYHVDDRNQPSPFSLHAGCATAQGKEKVIANMWISTQKKPDGWQNAYAQGSAQYRKPRKSR